MPPKELPTGAADDAPIKPKRSRVKVVMLLGSILLLCSAIGAGGYWWLYMRPDATGLSGLFSSSETPAETAGDNTKTEGSSEAPSSPQTAEPSTANANISIPAKPVPLPSLTVNLADMPGNRYLKIGLEVELSSPDAAEAIKAQNARIRDAIILLLSSKTAHRLNTAEGKVTLKNEIAARLNQILGAPRVVRIFFTEFVIQ